MSRVTLDKVVSIISSLNESVQFEDTNNTYGTEVLNNLVNVYEFILSQQYEKDIEEFSLIKTNNIIRNTFQTKYRINYATVIGRDANPVHPTEISYIMNRFLYLTSSHNTEDSPIDKAAMAQGMIYYVQPFEDGNKRTGRVLMDKHLIEGNYHPPLFDNRDYYIDTLFEVSENLSQDKKNGILFENKNSLTPLIKMIKEHQ